MEKLLVQALAGLVGVLWFVGTMKAWYWSRRAALALERLAGPAGASKPSSAPAIDDATAAAIRQGEAIERQNAKIYAVVTLAFIAIGLGIAFATGRL